jgi:penicillin-binding protein 2
MVKLGSAFSDNLASGTGTRSRHKSDDSPWWAGSGRALIFATIMFTGFFILVWRLFDLTVVHGREYRLLSDENRTRNLARHAPRGNLIDRTGLPLTQNIPQYRLVAPCAGNEGQTCISFITEEEGDRFVKEGGLPAGAYVEVDYVRRYVYGDTMAHVIGYTGELSEAELSSEYYTSRNYRLGDRVGRMGLEEVFNERLRGRDGRELVEIDANGKILRTLGRVEELPGEDIHTSLDAGLSKAAAAAFPPGAKGTIIVSKPQTGEILAMYSSPGFSPDSFSVGLSQATYDALMNNNDLPMFNRAIGGVYPPGSTFKLVTALAGLEEKSFDKNTLVEDTGVITIGQFKFPNWYFVQHGKTDGMVDVVKALKRSNDIFFYKAGEWIGITKLAHWARMVGVGKPTGIELAGEVGGLMPDPAWKKQRFNTVSDRQMRNDEWYVGDTYHVSIGQGYLLTTPLSVNVWTNIVANGGKRCKPTLKKLGLQEIVKNCTDLSIAKDTISVITHGMEEACAEGGTGWPLVNFGVSRGASPSAQTELAASDSAKIAVPVACKTGTAEFGDPKDNTHAWFTAFAPIPDTFVPAAVKSTENYISGQPEISVAVLVEGAGEGSSVAGPVAKKIFEEWFRR